MEDLEEQLTHEVESLKKKANDAAKHYTTQAINSGKSKLRKWMDSPLAEKVKTAGKAALKYGLPIAAAAVGAHYYGKRQGLNTPKLRSAKEMNELVRTSGDNYKAHQKELQEKADLIQRANEFHEKQYTEVWQELQAQKARNDALVNEGQRIIQGLRTQLNQNQANPQLQQALDNALQQQQAALQQQQALQQKVNTLKSAIKFKEAEITAGINAQAAAALKKQSKAHKKKVAALKLQQQIQNAAQAAQAQDAIGKASQDTQRELEQAKYELLLQQGATSQLLQENKQLWNHAMAEDKEGRFFNNPDSFTVGERGTQSFPVSFEANRLNQQNTRPPDRQYPMHKQQPIRVGITPVTSHKIAFKGKKQKEPAVRRETRVLTTTGRRKYQREAIRSTLRKGNEMHADGLSQTSGSGWADAARAFAPFMQTGLKVYQNHQYNEAARRKREMLAERLGVSPYDLEGLSSRGLLE
jgi:hypothetical protein